jgi:hypothetical protein
MTHTKSKTDMTDKYILIFEDKIGNVEGVEIQCILLVFDRIKLNLPRLKKNGMQITIKLNNYGKETK